MKQTLYHGAVSGLLAGLAASIFNEAYCQALIVDFTSVFTWLNLLAVCVFSCVLASLGYFFFAKWVKKGTDSWFNAIFLIISFITFLLPFSSELPMEIESPELFPGLTLPMHLFPILFWLATKPLFIKETPYNA
jgi:uncharacterized membrane protein